jgi:hypothetical protein
MEEKAIQHVQETIMNLWRSVMKYEEQQRDMGTGERDQIIQDCIDNAKEQIEIYTTILNKLEQ